MADSKPAAPKEKKVAAKTEAKPKVEKKAAASEAKPKVEKKAAPTKPKAAADKPKAAAKPKSEKKAAAPATTTDAKKPAGKAAPKAPKKTGDKTETKKVAKPKAGSKGRQGKKAPTKKFTIDCSTPVEDGIMDAANFEKFLHDRIKVNGKAGNLGDSVGVTRDKTKITVTTDLALSKRYLKYLTKKFLKAKKLRDWLHVVAVNKTSYELRYFNIEEAEESQPAAE